MQAFEFVGIVCDLTVDVCYNHFGVNAYFYG